MTLFHNTAGWERQWFHDVQILKNPVDFYPGSSTDPGVVVRIGARVKGRKVVVSLDSDHSMHHVLKELRLYSPLVSRASYIVVEDTNLDVVPVFPSEFPGSFAAVVKFLAGGWLRRK